VCDTDVAETHSPQDAEQTRSVEPPPVRAGVFQLVCRVERSGWSPDIEHVACGFDDQQPSRHCSDTLQRPERIAQVVKHTKKEHEIKGPDVLRIEVVDVYAGILDRRAEGFAREVEAPPVLAGYVG
jgi:hypothetical protein